MPKVGVPADLYMVEAMVNQIEMAKGFSTRVGLEALIETADLPGEACSRRS